MHQSFGSSQGQIEDDQESTIKPDQNLDIDPILLSGDEAMEKSFSVNSFSMAGKHGKTNMIQTSIVISKSILGVGILGLPNVTNKFGLIPTLLLILFFYFQTQYCTKLYLKCKNLCGRSNLSTIGYEIFKARWIIHFISITIFINNFGLCFAEMTIQATTIRKLIGYIIKGDIPWYLSWQLFSVLTALIMAPLMVIKKIEKLKNVGILGLFAMTIFTLTIISTVVIKRKVGDGFGLFNQNFQFSDAFAVFPTLLLAYNWEFNLFPVYKGMQKPSDRNIMFVSYTGMATSTGFYLLVGILGFVIYGNQTEANFINMMEADDVGTIQFILLNITFYLSTVLTTPLVFYGAKNNFIALIQSQKNKKQVYVNHDNSEVQLLLKEKKQRKRQKDIIYYSVSLILFTLIVIGAITINSLEVAFNIVGAVSSNSIGCVLPSWFYFKLVQQKIKSRFELTNWENIQYYGAIIFFIYSIIMSIVCVASEVKNIVGGH